MPKRKDKFLQIDIFLDETLLCTSHVLEIEHVILQINNKQRTKSVTVINNKRNLL
jgi:hypothetical protein